VLSETSCASNACDPSGGCAPPTLPPLTAPAADAGACDLASASRITVSGSYDIALTGTAGELSDNADVRRAYLGE